MSSLPVGVSPRPTNSLALSLFNVYKSNRSLFLNTAYIILLTAAFSRATNTGDPESKKAKSSSSSSSSTTTTTTSTDVETKDEKKKKHPHISKDSFKRLAKAVVPSIYDHTI
ncbi:hypothetical protein DFJ63DRAFT_254928, partial [Scheffersomyces coipomensis]|uniref:uncharacterized protein n=1 Tax=Scheffersomyces coipomensis TaxID=1788519 RepID=UPI00315DB64B